MDSFFSKTKEAFEDAAKHTKHLHSDVKEFFKGDFHSHTHLGHECSLLHTTTDNPYHSFAPPRTGNTGKYYVDGANYFHAVSVALENAKTSIWIMDWWLSPELYLRRPPSKNEQYRLDRMLLAAAQRGVQVNVMVYKEVPNVLTTCSEHTKHALEFLHPTIACMRHPDHNPSGRALASGIVSGLKSMNFTSGIKTLSEDAAEALYGFSDDVVLYWAHHEKLVLVDNHTVFMGGLDLCFGRFDSHQHSIADAHPTDINATVFPGQDFNNGRIMDFQDVTNFDKNKLDRTKNSRMGWSDISLCLEGDVVEDFRAHFVQRWNFIYSQKYNLQGERYKPLTMNYGGGESDLYHDNGRNKHIGPLADQLLGSDGDSAPAADGEEHHFSRFLGNVEGKFHRGLSRFTQPASSPQRGLNAQMLRSASRWSHGVPTEHSIANAYIEVIQDSDHFVYIENQFFLTATDDAQDPIRNKIGAAIVARILRAHEENSRYKMIISIPAVPGFAGDLHAEDSAGTLAIMNFQYESICRGGNSIIEQLQKAGIDNPGQYIRFFNLRNYDRINAGSAMAKAENASGVDYETARKQHDDIVGAGFDGRGEGTQARQGDAYAYESYQRNTQTSTVPDSVADCYMLNGPPLSSIPWSGSPEDEMDAFVSEELYIHSKVLIADDRVVICGSANLNDRSQLGNHDSEMAVVLSGGEVIESVMDGERYTVSKFAAGLRRQLFRKHLGLLSSQDLARLGNDGLPVGSGPNEYDWNSPPDLLVQDPLSEAFEQLWNSTARNNTAIFQRAFAPVPSDEVRTWQQYTELYGRLFVGHGEVGKEGRVEPTYQYGHVVKENFRDVAELKEWLGGVRGMLVEMPLMFLSGERELVKYGIAYNDVTAAIYT